jgi:hypothetical protein
MSSTNRSTKYEFGYHSCIAGVKLFYIEVIEVLLPFYDDDTRKTYNLATIAFESEIVKKICYDYIIRDFI